MSSPATNFSRSTTFELSTSSAFSSSAVKVEQLAASVFVSFDDLAFLDLLAGSRIMRPEGDPGRSGALIPISAGIVGAEPRYRWRRTLLPATQIREVVFVYIDRRWFATPGASERVSCVSSPATNRSGGTTSERCRKPRQLARGIS